MQRAKTYNFDEMTQLDKVMKDYNYMDDDHLEPCSLVEEDLIKNFNLNDYVSASLKLESGFLPSDREENILMKMLASLNVSDIEGYKRPNIDLVCVLDHSGSMQGEKIELVKNSFKYLLDFFTDNDRLSIIIFNHSAKRLFPLIKMTEENKKRAYQEIRSIWAIGGTDINNALCHGLHVLQSRKVKNKVSSIFLLSDGIDETAEFGFKRSINSATIEDEFTIHTFGFGNDHDSKLMTKIADMQDGNFYFLEQFNLIDECFVDCFGQLMCATAQDVRITITVTPEAIKQGISIHKAFGNDAMWEINDDEYSTRLSNLLIGKSRNFVLELEIPPEVEIAKEKIEVAKMSVTMIDFRDDEISLETAAFLSNEAEIQVLDSDAEKEVMLQYFRVNAALAMELAYTLCVQNKFEEARQELVEAMKKMYHEKKYEKEEFVQNLIKDLERAFLDCNENQFGKHGGHNLLGNARAQMKETTYSYSSNYYGTSVQKALKDMLKQKKTVVSKVGSKLLSGKEETVEKSIKEKNNTSIDEVDEDDEDRTVVVKLLYDEGLEFTVKEFVNNIEYDALRAEIYSLVEFKEEEPPKEPTLYIMVLHRVDVISQEKIDICERMVRLNGDKSMIVLLKHPYNMNRNLKLDRKGCYAFHQFNYGINSVAKSKTEVEHVQFLSLQDKDTLFQSFQDFIKTVSK